MSTSNSSTTHRKHDVFLCFRGADTRNSFVSHLYADLSRNEIAAFMDHKLSGGEELSPALLRTIEDSTIALVVLSKNFADSRWCLDELEKILECKDKFDQKVLPVFYQVDPGDIRGLRGSFGDAIVKHQQQFSADKVESWSLALKKIANLKGWNSNNNKPETELIQEIVDDILKKLNGVVTPVDAKQGAKLQGTRKSNNSSRNSYNNINDSCYNNISRWFYNNNNNNNNNGGGNNNNNGGGINNNNNGGGINNNNNNNNGGGINNNNNNNNGGGINNNNNNNNGGINNNNNNSGGNNINNNNNNNNGDINNNNNNN